ncbi:related to isotrichodermin C-15 hydroxylase (cytochrome P-450 monooxygenase CYP65A1) [Phialocephala subalpina]|uniref:Related to isotrichodermin C-15 hydroxylase (Cytochrome P-450 monooxygenase CYP65A1) n=1 Tax=Phialocephala subalpina TaxID=576137 RepID=A0A1L7XK44_9HELO|nr:related to isotrichodermin C-15 hydroxylase (cytochrome P-450 monooxygenase CYP65A1) [Phialocephala subalpina]
MAAYLVTFLAALSVLLGGISVYRLYLSPLAKFPGPKTWAISRLPMAYNLLWCGHLPYKIAELHEKYGPVVRLAPTEISFITPDAWTDIYGRSPGKPQLLKDPFSFLRRAGQWNDLLFEPDDVQHARMRRVFSHAFSEKALRDQEPIVNLYVNKMISRLRDVCKEPVNISAWINFATFDTIGDLTFGESFQCLENGRLHWWAANIYTWISAAAKFGMTQHFGPLGKVLLWLVPKDQREAERVHRATTKGFLDARLNSLRANPDIISTLLPFIDIPDGITFMELFQTCFIFMSGGSELTTTGLSGMIYYILQDRKALDRMVNEIRSSFTDASEITMAGVQKLDYTLAVIKEGLRLYPPFPGNLRRITPPEGWIISGHNIPGNTLVAVDMYAANRSASNFHRPHEFVPERWLADPPAEFANDNLNVVQVWSVGPRQCIGKSLSYMETRLIMAQLFFNFDIEVLPESVGWAEKLKVYGFRKRTPFMIKMVPVE